MSTPLRTPCPSCGAVALESFAEGEPLNLASLVPTSRGASPCVRCNACLRLFVAEAVIPILKAEPGATWTGTDAGDPRAEQAPPEPGRPLAEPCLLCEGPLRAYDETEERPLKAHAHCAGCGAWFYGGDLATILEKESARKAEPLHSWEGRDGHQYALFYGGVGWDATWPRTNRLYGNGEWKLAHEECETAAELARVAAALKERQKANAALMRDNGKLTEEVRSWKEIATESDKEARAARFDANCADEALAGATRKVDALLGAVGIGETAASEAGISVRTIRDLHERAELGDLARRDAHALREEVQRQTLLKAGARAEAERLRGKLFEVLAAAPEIPGSAFRAKEHARLREYLKGRGLWRPIGTDRAGGTVNCAIEALEANRELAADLKRERSRAVGIAANFLTAESLATEMQRRAAHYQLAFEDSAADVARIRQDLGRVRAACEETEEARLAALAEIQAGERERAELHREVDGMRDAFAPLVDLVLDADVSSGEPLRTVSDVITAAVAELRQRRKDADGGLEEDRDQWAAACRAAEARLASTEAERVRLSERVGAAYEERDTLKRKARDWAAACNSAEEFRHLLTAQLQAQRARADALEEGNRALGLELEAVRRTLRDEMAFSSRLRLTCEAKAGVARVETRAECARMAETYSTQQRALIAETPPGSTARARAMGRALAAIQLAQAFRRLA